MGGESVKWMEMIRREVQCKGLGSVGLWKDWTAASSKNERGSVGA